MSLKHILPGKLGFGTAPLGNMFRDIPEDEALATVEAAWNDGIRYFDSAPFYGAGLAELRMGEALAGKPRGEYVISTKVGRVILDEVEDVSARRQGEKAGVFAHGRTNRIVNDYSRDATLRSMEDSLRRLRTDHVEIVFVHDLARDFWGDEWIAHFEEARTGAFRALDRLRDEGVIRAWGLGVNLCEPIETLLDLQEPRPDGFLLAGRYTLLDHDRALQRVMPTLAERDLTGDGVADWCEWLAGEVRERQQVGNGQVVIFENDEAYRFVGDAPVRKLIIKVTVEGGYFKNK